MKLKKKTIAALALAACLSVAPLAGCGETAEKYPEYEADKHLWIGGWDVPINTLADYQLAKDMGLTHIFIDSMFEKKGTPGYLQQLEYCEQVGLKAIVGSDTSLSGAGLGSEENVTIDSFDYSPYSAVDMINVWDEPGSDHFGEVAARIEKYNALYEGKRDITMYVNLDPAFHKSHDALSVDDNMKAHVDKFVDQVLPKINGRKIISTDIYPLMKSPSGNEYLLLSTWLPQMETLKEAAVASGSEFHMFIQSYSAGNNRDIQSEEDLLFQIYTVMAFGVDGFSYFTYRESFLAGFGGGCVSKDESATPLEMYYWAQSANEKITKFDHVFLAFDEWKGVMPVNGTNNLVDDEEYNNNGFVLAHPVTKLDCAKSVSATEDTIIGQFEDKDGNDGLMVVNFNDPANNLTDVVSFEFEKANRALVYRDGERLVYEVKNNKLSLELGVGEGVFVIPVQV